ncbi:hypothetical protein ACFFQF_32655 [Haladaptatus pallidirubidus]|uniref:HEPN domain-containing protein n=1 Tax=Haladaptatus pallidirubidus TaxID=1008152 RepID=A0AAV3UPU5_9EURY|nr:hypothetical protein [Haladaptatus pallidirubidus]
MPEEDYVGEELEQARTALTDAKILQEGRGSDTAVVNRLYYACFHAAQAVLYAKGLIQLRIVAFQLFSAKKSSSKGMRPETTVDFYLNCGTIVSRPITATNHLTSI